MATKNIAPRADGEGNIGTSAKNWLKGWFKSIFLGTNGIVDSNGNEVLKPESVASAINEITIKNAAVGNAPESKVTGDDTDINYVIRVKGSGAFQVMDGAGNILATFDKVASAVNYITLLNSATGNGVVSKAVGTDTDIDYIIKTKGVGKIQLLDGNDNEIAEFHSIASAVNFIKLLASATGNGVTAQAIGGDTDIDFIIKTKGVGKFQILDGNDNEIAEFHTVASAVNFLKFLASATGNTLKIEAIGDDTNIDILLVPKGSGKTKTSDGQIVVKTAPAMTAGKMVKTNADGVVEDGTNTDTNVADAVTKKHSQNTDTGSDADPFTLTGKFKRSSQVGITAYAGGGQGSAVEITKDIVEIAVCATGGDSVKLPAAVAGLVILITNHGAAAADVFPNTDDAINEAAANTAKSLGIDASMLCIAYDATNWECLTLAR